MIGSGVKSAGGAKGFVDWELIEINYRANRVSIREIARQFGITDSAIVHYAKDHGWVRDLGAAVTKATEVALMRKAIEQRQAEREGRAPPSEAEKLAQPVMKLVPRDRPATDDEVVEAAAEANVVIIQSQQATIKTAMGLCADMMQQLILVANNRSYYEAVALDICKSSAHRREALMKAVSMPQHATVLKDLTTAARNLIALQRQAHNMDQDKGEGTIEDILAKLRDDE